MKKQYFLVALSFAFLFSNITACKSEEKLPEYKVLENVYTIEHFGKDKYTFILVPKNLNKSQIDLICKNVIKKYPDRNFYLYSDKNTVNKIKEHIQKGKMDYELTEVMTKNWIGIIDDRSGKNKFFPLVGYNILE